MLETLTSSTGQVVVSLAVLTILVVAAFYIVQKVREGPEYDCVDAGDLLAKFRELHSQGGLSDEEFRTIKTQLSGQISSELRDNDKKG